MKGEQHVFFSLLSAAILFPLIAAFQDPLIILLFMAGVFAGSLAPDADAADSAIMHGLSGGRGSIRTLRRHTVLFLPVFGYTVRYLIYFPVSFVMWAATLGRVRPRHRGLLHSFFGVFVTSCLLWVYTGIAIRLITGTFELWHGPAAVLSAGFFAGCLMHLLEDSCTHGGVFWLFPFRKTKLSGTLIPDGRRNFLVLLVLGASAVFSLYTFENPDIPAGISAAAPLILFSSAWTLIFFISGVSRG